MRITSPTTKVGYFLIVVFGITLTAIPLAAISYELGFAWAAIALVAAVVVAARTFRGTGESDAPRSWWKMTSTRGSAVLLSVLFFIQGVTASFGAFASPSPPLTVTGGVVAVMLAVLYLNSAIRVQHRAAQPIRGEL